MATLETDRTIFCPAFPEYTVTVFQGRMFLSHIMLGESSKRFDPVTPMTNSNLVEVLQAQSKSQVGLVSHPVLARGLDEAKAYVDKEVKDGKNCFWSTRWMTQMLRVSQNYAYTGRSQPAPMRCPCF